MEGQEPKPQSHASCGVAGAAEDFGDCCDFGNCAVTCIGRFVLGLKVC